MIAALFGHLEFVKKLVEFSKTSTKQLNQDGSYTPLHLAAVNGDMDMVKLLLDFGNQADSVPYVFEERQKWEKPSSLRSY